jgi:hypothetical protein
MQTVLVEVDMIFLVNVKLVGDLVAGKEQPLNIGHLFPVRAPLSTRYANMVPTLASRSYNE